MDFRVMPPRRSDHMLQGRTRARRKRGDDLYEMGTAEFAEFMAAFRRLNGIGTVSPDTAAQAHEDGAE